MAIIKMAFCLISMTCLIITAMTDPVLPWVHTQPKTALGF